MASMVFMLLCGGQGKRLWPLSRKSKPKQLLQMISGKTLLENTIDRLVSFEDADIGLVTTKSYVQAIDTCLGDKVDFYVVEPCARNTAAAIALGVEQVLKSNDTDPVMVFLPSDHYIGDNQAFAQAIEVAIAHAKNHDDIVLVGIKPTYPATGYGYAATHQLDQADILKVIKFHEKPDLQTAENYLEHGNVFWNAGIFVARASVLHHAIKTNQPELHQSIFKYVHEMGDYQDVPALSFDRAVIEHCTNVSLVPGEFPWKDVGSIENFTELFVGAQKDASVFSHKGHSNIACSTKKMIVFLGVSDVCLVETDDVIVVMQRGQAEAMSDVVAHLEKGPMENLL